ncbi:MAG: hypothetical protein OES47_12765 [Acidobacteriota bacterium]|nr:hypothetical protein [Acidobacteriota bacterium]
MKNDRALTIHFNDGTRLSFSFPAQTDPRWVTKKTEELLEHEHLSIEADGTLLVFPLSSIKYLQATPAPDVLPANVIKGASVLA